MDAAELEHNRLERIRRAKGALEDALEIEPTNKRWTADAVGKIRDRVEFAIRALESAEREE